MSELKPIRIGDRVTKFPAQTHNALIAGEQERKNALAQIDDLRKPKLKSPVVIRVICQGLDAVTAPGSCVKLGDVAHEPATYEWAPYDGVVLLAYGWEAADKWEPFAILMEPAANGQVVDAVIPGAYWAKLNITDANHTHAVRPDEDDIVLVSSTYGQRIIWKESGTGEKWAIVRLEDSEVRYQLAVVQNVVSAGTGTYAGTVDSSYTIHDGSTVSLYLLTADTGMLAGQKVESTSLVTALDIRRDGEAKVGDVVRVWSASGVPVLPGSGTAADTFCDVLNAGDYLRGLDNYTLADDQVLTHDTTTGEITWMAQADLPGGGGGGGGDTVAEGYAIDITGTTTKTIANDPTEWTDFAAQFQFFCHLNTATAKTDPKWNTVTAFDATKDQMWWHRSGAFRAQTTADYNTTEELQLVSDEGNWKWVTATKLISFIYHSATMGPIEAATRMAGGPTIRPREITVEICEEDDVTDNLVPTGRTIAVQYRDGITLPQLAAGYVYAGEALQVYGASSPVVLSIYCKEWQE